MNLLPISPIDCSTRTIGTKLRRNWSKTRKCGAKNRDADSSILLRSIVMRHVCGLVFSVAFILSRLKCFQIDQTVSYNAFRAPLFLHNMCNMIYYLLGLCRILLLSIGIVCLFYLLFGGSMEMNASVYIMMNQDGSHVVIIAFHEPKWKIVSKLSSSTDFK